MRLRKSRWRSVLVALLATTAGIGFFAPPASAAELGSGTPESSNVDTAPTPDGVSEAEWSLAITTAQEQFGEGDRAYLEALKAAAPRSVTYCTQRTIVNVVPPGIYAIPTAPGVGTNCVMESGLTNNAAVRVLQTALNHCYGRSLVVDGSFGPATYSGLMHAQSVHGIGVDGVYGPTTRSHLKFPGSSGCLPLSAL